MAHCHIMCQVDSNRYGRGVSEQKMADNKLKDEDFLAAVQAFVAEKWKRGNPCDRCGSSQWSILPGKETVLSVDASDPDRDVGRSTDVVEFIPIYCNNCGNTVNIFMGVFMEWLVKNRPTM
jgi:hypothetical protein